MSDRARSAPGLPPAVRRRARRVSLALGLTVSLLVVALLAGGLLQPLESVVTSLQMRLRGPRPPQPDVVVVAIDDTAVDRFGRWPWPRDCVAAVIDALAAAGAAVIALDIVFSEPTRSPPGVDLSQQDRELARAFEDAGTVVLGFFLREAEGNGTSPQAVEPGDAATPPLACAAPQLVGEDPRVGGWLSVGGGPYEIKQAASAEANLDLFEAAGAGFGFFSHRRDEGVQQRYDLVTRLAADGRDLYYPALALAAVARYRGLEPSIAAAAGAPELRLGEAPVPADDRLRLWIDYAGPQGHYPTLSVIEVLSRPPAALAEQVGGKLVFLGATETGIGDVVSTPFAEMPGVEVHANAAGNLLSGRAVRGGFPQLALSLAALFALGLLVPLLVANPRRHLVGSVFAIAAVFAWPFVCHLAFRAAGWHLQVVAPMLAGGLALVASLRYQVGTVEARARHVKGLFQRYVSPEVVEELLARESVQLGGEERRMTVLFCDIRGFTNMSEQLADSTAVVAVLNEFFTPMTDIVLAEGGTLDKYMGDAMMAFFGAPLEQPDHAARACRAALAMRGRLASLNESWRAEGKPAVGIGIGLNSGEMTVGNMGSDSVFDYTVIGDAVNLGSRVEGLNKVYGTEVLVSGATVEAAGYGFLFRLLDRVRVKGKTEAVALYELMAADPAPAAARRTAERFAAARALYLEREFTAAEAAFAPLAAGDGPSALYVERCGRYRTDPPAADWDGVETFVTK